ncbi:uncharacterized protein LOC128853855 [Cuculus canorus]|uniref:uncharacterized protein LOC128853855 n=1 Tax=Cuculus canorus TaxID=55661 RepID=UPI0023AA31DB|nr:uncharacterized protein LOC128853855 [Cuculus canorus]
MRRTRALPARGRSQRHAESAEVPRAKRCGPSRLPFVLSVGAQSPPREAAGETPTRQEEGNGAAVAAEGSRGKGQGRAGGRLARPGHLWAGLENGGGRGGRGAACLQRYRRRGGLARVPHENGEARRKQKKTKKTPKAQPGAVGEERSGLKAVGGRGEDGCARRRSMSYPRKLLRHDDCSRPLSFCSHLCPGRGDPGGRLRARQRPQLGLRKAGRAPVRELLGGWDWCSPCSQGTVAVPGRPGAPLGGERHRKSRTAAAPGELVSAVAGWWRWHCLALTLHSRFGVFLKVEKCQKSELMDFTL